MRSGRLAVAVVAAALLAGLVAPLGRPDGDPASDYLVGQKVFLPFDAKVSQADQQKLLATVAQAGKQGYPIRVAVIPSDYDLGSVTSLWRKPQLYARFLSAELGFVYKGRLLIVMPNGFGFNYPKHSSTSEYAVLTKIPVASTPTGLTRAATTATLRLAAAQGIHLVVPTTPVASASTQNRNDRLTIIVAVAAALLLGLLLRLLVRRRAATRSS